jgi:phosphatidate phosphatase APP1
MIRLYQPEDYKEIARIFPRAVHEIAIREYSAAQCNAWSEKEPNPNHWKIRCKQKQPFVFVESGIVIGFLELDDDGHIDCMYVVNAHII